MRRRICHFSELSQIDLCKLSGSSRYLLKNWRGERKRSSIAEASNISAVSHLMHTWPTTPEIAVQEVRAATSTAFLCTFNSAPRSAIETGLRLGTPGYAV